MDLLIETPEGLQAVEVKSGATFASDWTGPVQRWRQLAGAHTRLPMVVHGGAGQFERQGCLAVGWREFALALG